MVVIGIDIGGTFTDFVLLREGVITVHKTPSTPWDPSEAFLRGIEDLDVPPGARYVHGSTVATNAVLERRGARAAFLATEGFRDLLQLQRQTRLELYSFEPTAPEPLIPRERTRDVPERVDRFGEVVTPLDLEALDRVLDELEATGAESLAIVFLFSFANSEHERLAAERARARGWDVSVSHEILPEYREYERASTTAANAYVAPLMSRYLRRLEERLTVRQPARLQIMQSNGGLLGVDRASREAVRTILSGPAGGVIGAAHISAAAGFERIIGLDMGGTSTDVALIEGEPVPNTEGMVSGLPIRAPMLDIHTVGAGGGSIARVDLGGMLRVGPESAGADPGPAAYGRGAFATVTDANLILGRLPDLGLLGGKMPLDRDAAARAVGQIAGQLELGLEEAALGIIRVANVQMARAVRKVSVERGHDPRRFCLVAFGGAGPLHACELAEETGIDTVLVPRFPGLLSALGMILSDLRLEYSRTVMFHSDVASDVLSRVFEELEAQARAAMTAEGASAEDLELARFADVRYRGQSYELSVPVESATGSAIRASFNERHLERFGASNPERGVEIVHLRVRARAPGDAIRLGGEQLHPHPAAEQGRTAIWLNGWTECSVYDRTALAPGGRLSGPAVVTQGDSTVWIPANWSGQADSCSNLILHRTEDPGDGER